MLSNLRAMLAAEAYVEALGEAERLLRECRVAVADQARVHVAACQALVAIGRPFHAIVHGTAAIACADRAGAKADQVEARFQLGKAAALVGDSSLAEGHLRSCLEREPGGGRAPEAQVLLGELACRRRHWLDGARLFQEAMAGLRAPAHLAQAALDLAWCHLMLRSPAEAEPWLDQASASLAKAAGSGPPAAEVMCHRALAARLRGDLDGSDLLCREVLAGPGGGAGPRQLGLASWILGENALDRSDGAEAARLAKLALEHAVRANQPALMNLAGDLRRRMAGT